jgi:GntR family transcriptional regulator/MocR family aminotransferase
VQAAGTAAGLHVLLHLPDGTDTRRTVRAAASAGLRLADLDDYRTEQETGRALVLGYGNIGDTEIPAAVALLREALHPTARAGTGARPVPDRTDSAQR